MQNYVESKVRNIVDFPKKGIIFRDITTAVKDSKALKFMIDFLKFLITGQGRGSSCILEPLIMNVKCG